MRNLLNSLLSLYKLKLIQLKEDFEPICVEKNFTNPSCLNYLANQQPIVMLMPLEKGRALPLFTFSKESQHPYVLSVKNALQSDKPKDAIRNTLKSYYTSFNPASAASLVGLHNSHALNKEPHWAIVLPWNTDSVRQWKERIQKSVAWENKINGTKIEIKDGWAWAGPVSEVKLDLETERLYKTYESVKKTGYKRNNSSDGDIHAYALIAENGDWVWQSQFGQHRACVVSALSYHEIPVRISKTIYRSEADHWPNVVSGLYTKDEVLNVFDMIFHGNYPKEASDWNLNAIRRG